MYLLIVSSDPALRPQLTRALIRERHKINQVLSEAELQAELRHTFKPDCIIIGEMSVGHSAEDLLKRIRLEYGLTSQVLILLGEEDVTAERASHAQSLNAAYVPSQPLHAISEYLKAT